MRVALFKGEGSKGFEGGTTGTSEIDMTATDGDEEEGGIFEDEALGFMSERAMRLNPIPGDGMDLGRMIAGRVMIRIVAITDVLSELGKPDVRGVTNGSTSSGNFLVETIEDVLGIDGGVNIQRIFTRRAVTNAGGGEEALAIGELGKFFSDDETNLVG